MCPLGPASQCPTLVRSQLAHKASLELVASARVALTIYHPEVVEDKPIAELMPFLLGCDIPGIVIFQDLEVSEYTTPSAFGSQFPHAMALDNLTKFAEATSLEQIVLPPALADHDAIPWTSASVILGIVCIVRDLISAAAYIHENLIMPAADSHKVNLKLLFSEVPQCLRIMAETLGELDTILMGPAAMSIEKSGIVLCNPLALIREWKKTMCIDRKRMLDNMLEELMHALSSSVARCTEVTPSWSAIFGNGDFNQALAARLMTSKLEPIVEAHNKLHHMLSQLNSIAKVLEVQPRLQDHPLTSETVAISLATMANSSTAAIVCLGCEVLRHQGDPSGSAKAEQFLTEHRSREPARPLPDVFWSEFEAMSSLARPTSSAPPPVADHGDERGSVARDVRPATAAASSLKRSSTTISSTASSLGTSQSPASHPQSAANAKAKPLGLKRMRR